MENTDNEKYATFTAHIINTPDQDSEGNYQTTEWKTAVNKLTRETIRHKYYDDWYQFSIILNSMVVNGQKRNLPSNFKIDIYILCRLDGRYIEPVKHVVPPIRIYSDVQFKGLPQKIDMSGKAHTMELEDVEDADEIYINEECVNTIWVKQPTRDTLERQSQYAQARVKEKSERYKLRLGDRFKWFWISTIKSFRKAIEYIKGKSIRAILIVLAIVFLWRYWRGVISYIGNNPSEIVVNLLISIVGGLIVKWGLEKKF